MIHQLAERSVEEPAKMDAVIVETQKELQPNPSTEEMDGQPMQYVR
jgi:hypothetical protein